MNKRFLSTTLSPCLLTAILVAELVTQAGLASSRPLQEPPDEPPVGWSAPGSKSQSTKPLYSFTDEVSVQWVSVPVVVAPRPGFSGALPEVEATQLRLQVDGRTVPIEEFVSAAAPASILYLQDLSGSMGLRDRIEQSRELARLLLSQLALGDEVALVPFAASSLPSAVSFRTDFVALRQNTQDWTGFGMSAVRDAAAATGELLVSATGRPAAILVTDGADNASILDPEAVKGVLSNLGIPLIVVAMSPPHHQLERAGHDSEPGEAAAAEFTLPALVGASGGRYLEIDSSPTRSPQHAAATILADLRRMARVGFSTDSSRPPAYHQIDVSSPSGAFSIRHRTRYYGHPPTVLLSAQTRPPLRSGSSPPIHQE